MSKLYKIIAVMCIAALLLCGCVSNGGPGETDPALNAGPTESTPVPTEPSTEPTSPTTEPTQPPTQPPTEPSTERTPPEGCISKEEAITAAAEFLQITDYQAECYFKAEDVETKLGVMRFDRYIVTMDDGKYIYEFTVDLLRGNVTSVTCTLKEGSVYPGGPALPPADMTREEVDEQYTVVYPLSPEGEKGFTAGKTESIEIEIYFYDIPLGTAIDGITIRTSDGKPIFQHDGRLYIWESDNVFTYTGMWSYNYDKILTYTLHDGSYELMIDFDGSGERVTYEEDIDYYNGISLDYGKFLSSPIAHWAFPINGATLLEVSNYEKHEVKGFQVTDNGKIEIVPDDTPYD